MKDNLVNESGNLVNDCISKQVALDIVDSYSESQSNVEDVTQDIISDIMGLPPVTPQQKTGRWILTDVEGNRVWHCKCSECKKDPQDYIGGSEDWWLIKNKLPKYCPNCGAKMQEVEE